MSASEWCWRLVGVQHIARCFNSKRTSFHVALELEHVESVNLRSAIRKADAVLPVFARAGQRSDTLKRVARRGRCRLLFRLGVQHIVVVVVRTPTPNYLRQASQNLGKYSRGVKCDELTESGEACAALTIFL